ISSGTAKVGETVDFEVLEDVKVGEIVVIPHGGTAGATVTYVQQKKRLGRGGKLTQNIDSVSLITGEKAALRAIKENRGGERIVVMTGAIAATTLVFFSAAPFMLFMKGKEMTILKGTEITVYTNGDVPLDPKKFTPPSSDQGQT